jgi:chromosome segregation ATPase
MNRIFAGLNLFLLLVLGGTCVYQWRQEGAYGARIAELQKQTDQQQNKLLAQAEDLRRSNEDLDGFKKTVATLTTQDEEQAAEIRQQRAKVFVLENEKDKLAKQLAAWAHALDEHKAALADRDQNIQTLLAQRDQLAAAQSEAAGKANHAIAAYNELATKYDDVVGRFNALATQFKAERDAAAAAIAAK